MSETTTGATQGHRTNPVTTALLLVALFAVLAFSFVVAPRPDHPDEEAFGGTDAQVTAMLEDDGHEPWFSPIFEPGSGEINYAWLFRYIDQLGYDGWIGCEYKPRATTGEGLGWLADIGR